MARIKEDYVSFEIAKLLKEKGFPQDTFRCHYIIDGNIHYKKFENRCGFGDYDIIAPTLAMAMKWLREVHNIDIFPWKIGKGIYSCAIFNSITGQDLSSNKDFPSERYEETVEEAIRYCLENLI